MLASPLTRRLRIRSLGPTTVKVVGLGSFVPSLSPGYGVTSAYSAQIEGAYNQATASARASIEDATGVDTNSKTLSQGASSAATLLENGYNPDSDSDNANLVHAIAGGLCLVPGVGPILGAAVEGLWQVGHFIEAPLQNALASIGIGFPANQPPCSTSGDWSTMSVLDANKGALPPVWKTSGSFGALVVPALAYASAMLGKCQKTPPADAIVDACVNIWNETHAGPSLPVYIPAINAQFGSLSVAPGLLFAGAGQKISGTTPAAKAGLHPNIYYAFVPILDGFDTQYIGVDWTKPPTKDQPFWLPLGASPYQAATASVPPGMVATFPRIVQLNAGALIPPSTKPRKVIPLVLGTKSSGAAALTPAQAIAMTALGTVVAIGAGGSIYALATHQSVGGFWEKIWSSAITGAKKLVGVR